MMRTGYLLVFLLISRCVFAQESTYNLKSYMEKKGYIEFDRKEQFYSDIFDKACTDILGENYANMALTNVFIIMPDGLEYTLLYLSDYPDLPNIISIYYDDAISKTAFYKVNYQLEGRILPMKDRDAEKWESTILAFY